jgi:hypothetical protein
MTTDQKIMKNKVGLLELPEEEKVTHSEIVTKHPSPQTNGICERFHKTMQSEFYAVAFCKKLYKSIDELQVDLDRLV